MSLVFVLSVFILSMHILCCDRTIPQPFLVADKYAAKQHKGNMITWKTIDGYPDYEISNTGLVKSIRYSRLLKGAKSSNGYYYVNLLQNKIKKTTAIHRIVMDHFGKPMPENSIIDHKDTVKSNNCIDNLEWVSVKENTLRYYNNAEKKANIPVLRQQGLTIKEIANIIGLGASTVQQEINKP